MTAPAWKIVNREKLLQDLADGLKYSYHVKLGTVQAEFYRKGRLLMIAAVPIALDYLINDTYYDATHNWSMADQIKVTSI